MGVIGRILGGSGGIAALGDTVKDVSEVFTANATRRMELSAKAQETAMAEHGAEFVTVGDGWFDRFVNGLNRMPRPLMAFGTLALFGYAMVDPPRFSDRMEGLNKVPEPLWWLLGAIVSFYFGAREAYYFRNRRVSGQTTSPAPSGTEPHDPAPEEENGALDDWRQTGGA